jgi:hypothetical protein
VSQSSAMRNDSLAFAIHLLSPTARERGSEPTIICLCLEISHISLSYSIILQIRHQEEKRATTPVEAA